MGKGGECPTCGRVISAPSKAPWHFKALVVSAAIYLAWRVVQGLEWAVQHIVA
ncbi:MAG: hypothetical protein Q8K63_11160 [Acidimicrobiales bacterium]|nr:hypothetical protein [Acidimicrobiales bacterium]